MSDEYLSLLLSVTTYPWRHLTVCTIDLLGRQAYGRALNKWPLCLTPVFSLLQFSIRDLLKFKEEVTKERDQLLTEVVKLRENLAQTSEQQQETERAKEDAEQTISQVCSLCSGWRLICPSGLLSHLIPLSDTTPNVLSSGLFLWFCFLSPLCLGFCLSSH